MVRPEKSQIIAIRAVFAAAAFSAANGSMIASASAQMTDGNRIERVQNPCEMYGAGFVAIAGTHTCVRVGGHVRVELGTSRPIGFDRASPLDTPHADLRGSGLVQGGGDMIPAGLRYEGAPTE